MHTPERDLPTDLNELVEILAENTYNIRARQRIANSEFADEAEPPGFPPYEELAETAKQDHRNLAIETLKLVRSLGYKLDTQQHASLSADGKKTATSESVALSQI